jgi:hypothetical protein
MSFVGKLLVKNVITPAGVIMPPEPAIQIIGAESIVDNPTIGATVVTLGSGGSGWQTARDVDLTAQGAITIPTNSTFLIAGDTWTSYNSAASSPAMSIASGTGLVLTPTSSTQLAYNEFTLPTIAIPLASLIPNFQISTPFRLYLNIGAANFGGSTDAAILGVTNQPGTTSAGSIIWSWWKANGPENKYLTSIGTNQVTATDTLATTHTVLIIEAPIGLAGGIINTYTGVMTGALGWPTAGNQWCHQCLQTLSGGYYSSDFGPQLQIGNYINFSGQLYLFFGAQRNGSGTSLVVDLSAYRVDYLATPP